MRLGEDAAEILGALLRRPGEEQAQAVLLVVEFEPEGGVLVDGLMTGPETPEDLRGLLERPGEEVDLEIIGAAELAGSLRAPLQYMVDSELALGIELMPPLLTLEGALGEPRASWPQPFVLPADADDELAPGEPALAEEDEEERLHDLADELVEEFADALEAGEAGPALLEHGPFVAHTLCSWKLDYADDSRLERWRAAELREFLLEWYPRKGDAQAELVAALPACAEAFLRFLADSGWLAGDGIERLAATLEALRGAFEQGAFDPRRWGPAKAMAMQMRAEGVDPSEPGAAEAWFATFNARPRAERDLVIGDAVERMAGQLPAAPASPSVGDERRKARRRSAKASRRRNRH